MATTYTTQSFQIPSVNTQINIYVNGANQYYISGNYVLINDGVNSLIAAVVAPPTPNSMLIQIAKIIGGGVGNIVANGAIVNYSAPPNFGPQTSNGNISSTIGSVNNLFAIQPINGMTFTATGITNSTALTSCNLILPSSVNGRWRVFVELDISALTVAPSAVITDAVPRAYFGIGTTLPGASPMTVFAGSNTANYPFMAPVIPNTSCVADTAVLLSTNYGTSYSSTNGHIVYSANFNDGANTSFSVLATCAYIGAVLYLQGGITLWGYPY